MEIDLIFKIAAVGIVVSILNQVLVRSGREEQATMTSLAALEAMKGEIEYRLTPLPELFAALGEGTEPVTAAFFRGCAAMMEADRALPPQLVLGRAMEQTTSLQWSARTRETVRNLAFSLGKFDLGGQVRAIELAQERLRAELAEEPL